VPESLGRLPPDAHLSPPIPCRRGGKLRVEVKNCSKDQKVRNINLWESSIHANSPTKAPLIQDCYSGPFLVKRRLQKPPGVQNKKNLARTRISKPRGGGAPKIGIRLGVNARKSCSDRKTRLAGNKWQGAGGEDYEFSS